MLSHLSPEFATDPHPTWDRLRAEHPVAWVPELEAWVIVGHAAARDALRDPSLSPSPRFWSHHRPPESGRDLTPRERFLSNGLFHVGPEDHTRLRRLLTAAFTPSGVQQQRANVARLVEGLLAGYGTGDEIDLFADCYTQIPPRVIADMTGFAGADADAFVDVARALILVIDPLPTDDVLQRIDHAVLQLAGMIAEASEHRRKHPGDDLLTRLLEVEDTEGRLTEEERVALIAGLVIAGSGTTAQFLAHATAALLDHPDQQVTAAREAVSRPAVLEEALRWTTMGYGAPRFAVTDTVLAGNDVAAGAMLFVAFPAANHDPAAFEDPHRFDIRRDASDHLSFSIGAHFCLGAALARLESGVVLDHVLDRFGTTMQATTGATYASSLLFRDVESLRVCL